MLNFLRWIKDCLPKLITTQTQIFPRVRNMTYKDRRYCFLSYIYTSVFTMTETQFACGPDTRFQTYTWIQTITGSWTTSIVFYSLHRMIHRHIPEIRRAKLSHRTGHISSTAPQCLLTACSLAKTASQTSCFFAKTASQTSCSFVKLQAKLPVPL